MLVPDHKSLKKTPETKNFSYFWPRSLQKLGYSNTLTASSELKWFVYPLSLFYYPANLLACYLSIKQFKPDVIHTHWVLPNGFIASLISGKIPLIISLPGSDVFLAKKNILFKLLSKFALSKAKAVTSNSPALLDDLKVVGKIVHYPVPTNNLPRGKNKKLVIATAGRIVEKKGFEIVKKAVPGIEVISGLPIDEFRKKLASVDIFICYSVRDKAGNLDDSSVVLLEAMAAGCAVIASNLPGHQTIITSGDDGFLVDSPKQLAQSTKKLQSSPFLRKKLGMNAKKKSTKFFTPKKIAHDYLSLIPFSEQPDKRWAPTLHKFK